jgi:replicative DNA helicase
MQGKKVLLVSLEMSVTDIQAKLVSQITGISTSELRGITHTKDEAKIKKIIEASAEIAQYKLYRIGKKGVTVADIENEILNLGGVDAVFIDYMQKIKARNLSEARHIQVEQISNDLSMLALSQDIPVVAIAILNREHVHRSDGRPSLADFRGSGVIEYDVTSALLLHRNEDEDVTEMIIAANRYGGGSGDSAIRFRFVPEKSRFYEIAEREAEEWQNRI